MTLNRAHTVTRRLPALVGAVVVASTLPMFVSTSAHAATKAKAWDFNGDGRRDIAVGASGENDNAGAVTVMRGTDDGLGTGSAVRFSQEAEGVPGTDEPGDQFGGSLASGDFDGDGFADLAIGAASEDMGDNPETGADAGAVTILYGSDKGLTSKGAHRLDRAEAELGSSDRQESQFGFRLVAADFDADGDHDLVVSTASGLGGVLVYNGRPAGLEGRLPALQIGPEHGLPASVTSGFASSLATGDLDTNGLPDLVIGLQENEFARGAVAVVYSSSQGLDPSGDHVRQRQIWTQDTTGVKGTAEPLDAFGSAVAVGDYTGDGHADLVVSAVQEPNLEAGVRGALHVLRGSNNGLTASGDEYMRHENIIGDAHGALGVELDIAKLNDNKRADIVVTAASNDALGNRWGRVLVLYGNIEGIGQGKQHDFTQATSGIPGGVSPTADSWGERLRIRDVGKSAAPDLLVADPRELIGTDDEVGRVVVLWGSKSGLDADRSRSLTQDTDGVPGTNEAGDRFGIGL